MFASTVRMWHSLDTFQALQDPSGSPLEDYVLTLGKRIYRSFHQHRSRIPEGQICDIRYEDLTSNPVATLERVYDQLDLGDFAQARPKVVEFMEARRTFKTNRHSLSDNWRRRVDRDWSDYIARYGYHGGAAARRVA